jgi:hypothetical protein
MAFGRKKQEVGPKINQSNVAMLATKALAERRAVHVQLGVRLVFTAPILMHRWTQKAIMQMLGKMVGMDMPRQSKDLTKEFEASWYRNTDGAVAIPCRIIKAALVNGAISTGGVVSKAQLNRELRVVGHTAPIYTAHGKPTPLAFTSLVNDIRIARNDSGSPDVRSRAIVPEGSWIDVVLQFPPTLTPDKVMAALEAAGDTIGICDFRPQTGGDYGTFRVDGDVRGDAQHIKAVIKACSLREEEFVIPPEMLRAFNAVPEEKLTDKARKARSILQANGAETTP